MNNPSFRAGFDLPKFAAAYTEITGRPFPIAVGPTPPPTPGPVASFPGSLVAAVSALSADPVAVAWLRLPQSGAAADVVAKVKAILSAPRA